MYLYIFYHSKKGLNKKNSTFCDNGKGDTKKCRELKGFTGKSDHVRY